MISFERPIGRARVAGPVLYSRLVLGLIARPGIAADGLVEALREEAAEALRMMAVEGAVARLALPVRQGTHGGSKAGYDDLFITGLTNGVTLGGIDAIVDVAVPSESDPKSLVLALAGLDGRLGHVVDVESSLAVVGTDFMILEGEGPVQLFYFMRRRRRLDLLEFTTTWRDEHTKISKFTPGLSGYRQLHSDATLSTLASERAGIRGPRVDGVALEWFDGVDAFLSATDAPLEFRVRARQSESKFNDLSKAVAVLTEVQHIVD
jgi:hypothetical protein